MRDSFRIQSFVGDQFHFAGGERRIDGLGSAQRHRAFDGDHVFGARAARLWRAAVRIAVDVEDELRDAFAIAQMDEDHAAQIAAAMHPAHQ